MLYLTTFCHGCQPDVKHDNIYLLVIKPLLDWCQILAKENIDMAGLP